MIKKDVEVRFPNEKDATKVALIVQEASKYDSTVYLEMDNKKVNVKSIMGMMGLVLKNGTVVTLIVDGQDEETAVANIAKKMSL